MSIQPFQPEMEPLNSGQQQLVELLALRRSIFDGLAKSWLDRGASYFGIWSGNRLLQGWPASHPGATPNLTAAIRVNNQMAGFLGVHWPTLSGSQKQLECEATLLSAWIQAENDSASMTADLVETQDQLLALYELSHSIRDLLGVPQIIEVLTRQAVRLTKAVAGFFWLSAAIENSNCQEIGLRSVYPRFSLDVEQEAALFEQCCQTRQAALLTGSHLPPVRPASIQALYIIPIQFRGAVIGVLGLGYDRPAEAISPDLKLSQAIARQTEAYIENALLQNKALQQAKLRTELELARQIQTQLLPDKIPSADRIEVAANMRPAYEVGGDLYDFAPTGDQSLFFILADAVGKGIPAALLMSMTRTVFRGTVNFVPLATPQALFEHALNNLYDDFTNTGLFVTAFAGRYYPQDHRLVYANAGHSPVIYRPAGGSARILEADAPPLGVLPTSLSVDHSLQVEPGDVLLVATDGFNEARNASDEMFGYERLLALVNSAAARNAAEIAALCYAQVDTFCDGFPQEDDQTLVVIKGI